MDLPRSLQLPQQHLFTTTSDQKLAGMTGKVRRDFCPFMWLSVLGLSGKPPDNDPLVQVLLLANHVSNEISMANVSLHSLSQSIHDIDRNQSLCHQLTLSVCTLFNLPVNTKEHRLLHHVKSHFVDFGLLLFGDTSYNETRHRRYKFVYDNTNKHLNELPFQMIKQLSTTEESESPNPHRLNKAALRYSTCMASCSCLLSNSSFQDDISHLNFVMSSDISMKDRLQNVSTKKSTNGKRVWQELTRITLPLKFSTLRNTTDQNGKDRFTVHKRNVQLKAVRTDYVFYRVDGVLYLGFVNTVLKHRKHPCRRLIILQRLVRTPPMLNNTKATTIFGHIPYKYECSDSDNVILDAVELIDVLMPCAVVLDPYWFGQKFGMRKRLSDQKVL